MHTRQEAAAEDPVEKVALVRQVKAAAAAKRVQREADAETAETAAGRGETGR